MTSFADLHQPGHPFLLVNVWDIGTARVAAGLGAQALATSSAGHAFTLGKVDGQITVGDAIAHAESIVQATPLPVSIDFENGYGHTADDVATNVTRVKDTGAAGLSIEDWDGNAAYDIAEATDRITAAIAAKGDMLLCARADGVMNSVYDVAQAVERCAQFAEAGADVLYAPVLPDQAALAEIVSLGKPVNGLAAGPWLNWTLDDWAQAGVARVSLGSTLARVTHRALLDALRPSLAQGHIPAMQHTPVAGEIDAILG
ncbi:MAG: isocitrate lyase/phosphoenolpyruvate mutase family protein [Pseudomonadota bacterium]